MVCKSLCDKTACPGCLPLPTPNVDHLPLLHRSLLSHLGLLHVLENIRRDLPLCTPPPGGCRAHSHSLFAQVSPSRRSLPRALLPPHGSCFFLSIQLSASHTLYWRRKWLLLQPTPVFLPGESQGQRSLVGCRLWGRTESDTTEST